MKISDFKLVVPGPERKSLIAELAAFNRTAQDFNRESTLHAVLVERMQSAKEMLAVVGEHDSLTYGELLALSGRIASWVMSLPPRPTRIVAVLMENTPQMPAAVLGSLRSGSVYLPLNPELPFERLRAIVEDSRADVLLTERKFAREANRLQWECEDLRYLLCLDSSDFKNEIESPGELSRVELWEYVGEEAKDAITGGGWKNSYTGENLPAEVMEEYTENAYRKLWPLLGPGSRVLEIGCSSGLTLLRLAPECGLYVGIDFSDSILAFTQEEVARRGLTNVRLHCLPAHEVDRIPDTGFDLIILNSVVQSFDGHNYLRRVLLKSARLLKPTGRIFLGDIMDQEKKAALIDSLVEFQQRHSGKGYATKTDWSAELFLSRRCIEDICLDIPGFAGVEHSRKIYTKPCELTEYRFDTLVTIHRGQAAVADPVQRCRFQCSGPDLERFSADPQARHTSSEDPAYMIYTSGTTGRPKGVVVCHRSIHNYVHWAARYYFAQGGGGMALFTSPAFDLTLTSIFVPLYLGQTIRSFRSGDIQRVLQAVFEAAQDARGEGINAIKLTPSHITILDQCDIQPAPIQVAIVGGEELTAGQVEVLRRLAPGIRIYNEYGPTEATIGCTVALVAGPSINIGKPVANTEIWILGQDGEVKPIGVPGELCVAGACLALGYWNDPDLTSKKFVPHPVRPQERIYRTGDLARWTSDGSLILLGRMDHQVKIRGNRIELQEIEERLRAIPEVRDAVVLARRDANGEQVLCAYLISSREIAVPAIRSFLLQVFPEYMAPSYFVFLKEFPLSPNGKVDRKKLPEPQEIARSHRKTYEPPVTKTEQALAGIWEEVLGLSPVGRDDNFFELGGHSLKATQVISRIHQRLELAVELRQVFRSPKLRDLAATVDQGRRFRFAPIDPLPEAEDYELSHAQRRMWLLQEIEAGQIAYNVHDVVEIEGDLDPAAVAEAFDCLVERHESLRTIIVPTPAGPRQRVLTDIGFQVVHVDLTGSANPVAAATDLARNQACFVFDLSQRPPIKVSLLRLGDRRHRLLLTMHHIVSDGWSAGILVRELMRFYRERRSERSSALPPLRVHYKDYAAWQNRLLRTAPELARFWHAQLAAPLPSLDLPRDFQRPAVKSFEGDSVRVALAPDLARQIREVARRRHASLFMMLNAAVKVFLHRLSGDQDIIIGVPIAGRTHVDLEHQIGFFVNTLALRDRVYPHEGFSELLARIRRTTTEAFEHQDYPFDRLAGELGLERDTSRSPVFDVMLVLHNNEHPEIAMEEMNFRYIEDDLRISRFDLTFHFFEADDGLHATLEYATKLFRRETIERLWLNFECLLQSAVETPGIPVAQLDVLPAPERAQLLEEFNRTSMPWEQSPLRMFREHVELQPGQEAVFCGGRFLNYKQLDLWSTALAARIRRQADAGDVIAVLLNRSERNLVAFLACMKAGCAYMPIDPSYPPERVAAILADSRASLAVTEPQAAGVSGIRVLTLAPGDRGGDDHSGFEAVEGEIAYVIYTSGSTGRPKGVIGTTQCLANLVSWQRSVMGYHLRSAQFAALGFDVSIQEMLYSVCSGGTLFVPEDQERMDPARLRDFIDRCHIELLTMPFSALNFLFSTQRGMEKSASLKHLITSGEQLRLTPELRLFLERRPDVQLHNQYGPSETHVVTSHTLSAGNLVELPPIGRPIANNQCYILDEWRQPVPIGVKGELYLSGVNLARGYLHNPELTTNRFVENPLRLGERMYQTGDVCRRRWDGEIEFLGRRDDQVKVRGYRVELGEVEAALSACPGVASACVVATSNGMYTELIGYYTASAPVAETVLRACLGRSLPNYMVPAQFVRVESMPLTSSGKVNRRALPDPSPVRDADPSADAGGSETELRVATAFNTVLKRKVGSNEDFFALGGHSLNAVQLAAELQREFALEVPLLTVFRRPTVSRMAEWIDDVLSYRRDHAEQFFAPLNRANGPVLFALPPLLGYGAAFRRLAELLPGHQVYGFDFIESPNLIEQYAAAIDSVQPAGRVVLLGYSAGGNLAFELAKYLEQVQRKPALVLLDSFRLEGATPQSDEQINRAIQLNLDYFDRYLESEPELRAFVSNETVRALLVKKMGGYLRYLDAIENMGAIAGDIHVIESVEFTGDPRRTAWRQATTGRFQTHSGFGTHIDMILESNIEANAAVLRRILEALEIA